MGAGASIDESGRLISAENHGPVDGDQLPQFPEDKQALVAQASANWHRMIVHANAVKKDANRREALVRVDSAMAMFESNDTMVEDHLVIRSRSDVSSLQAHPNQCSELSPENPRTSYDMDDAVDSPQTIGQRRKIERKPSRIQEMGVQFRREELAKELASSPSTSPDKKKSGASPSHRVYKEVTKEDLASLPPVRIDLKSRTSTSITIVWDVDFEALQALGRLVDQDGYQMRPMYEVMHRKSVRDNEQQQSDLFGMPLDHNSHALNLWRPACDDTLVSSAIVNDLLPNTLYAFRCRRMGWNEDWGPESVIRTGPGVPSDPVNLHAKEVTSISVLLQWSNPERDNGLPVLGYAVRVKPLGGEFQEIYRGKERVYMAHSLQANTVYIFDVVACNRIGAGPPSDRLAIRTMQPGSQAMTPWTEAIDEASGELYYFHPKTRSSAWALPEGALLDSDGSFHNKYLYLHSYLKGKGQAARRELAGDMHNVRLSIHRSNVLEESLRLLRLPTAQQLLAGPLRVAFIDEVGIDGGGIAREWTGMVLNQLLESSSGLMTTISSSDASNGDGVIIDIRSSVLHGVECRWLFAAIGKFFAKVIVDEHVLGVKFNDLFLSWLTGKPPTLEDLKRIDPAMYRGLEWVLNNPVHESDFTFSASYELFDEQITVDFIPSGRTVAVTDENKGKYVDLMLSWLISGRYEPALSYFVEAFHSVIPESVLKHFSTKEMQMIIGGSPEIDVLALQSQACYTGGYNPESEVVKWFWSIVISDLDVEMLSKLLTFITGCACVPSSGCLKPALTITRIEGRDSSAPTVGTAEYDAVAAADEEVVNMLPRAHTCFNQIVLPVYPTREALRDKLIYAIENSIGAGFHMT